VSQLETMIRQSAGDGEWVADWHDVLRRAGHSRFRSKRVAAVAAVAAAVVVLLLPGIGIGGGLNRLISGSSGPGLQLRAPLSANGRVIGAVSFRTSRVFVAVAPKSGRVGMVLPQAELRWSFQLAHGITVSSLRIVRHGEIAVRLCSPCTDGATGIVRANRRTFGALFGRGTVVADTSRGPARGTVRLQKPQR
jgi:hypothetical protein